MVVAATGFFDGVHQGHRAVLSALCALALKQGKRSAVVTFWPHPRNVLQQDADSLRLLNTLEEKRRLVLSLGVDDFHIVKFSREFSRLTTGQFLKEYLIDKFDVSTLVLGYDHKLGCSSGQTQPELIEIANSLGIETVKIEEVYFGENTVSSTKIRGMLAGGDVAGATPLLGYNYNISGVVVVGNRIGRTMGYPTANMQLYEPLKMIPANGVYLVKVNVLGFEYKGICNIGNRPTIGEGNARTIETHILDFNEEIYGLDISLDFICRIRDEKRFSSKEELSRQIFRDEEFARKRGE